MDRTKGIEMDRTKGTDTYGSSIHSICLVNLHIDFSFSFIFPFSIYFLCCHKSKNRMIQTNFHLHHPPLTPVCHLAFEHALAHEDNNI